MSTRDISIPQPPPVRPPIFNCPRAAYDAVDAMNQSTIKLAEKSMDHVRTALTKPKREASEPQILGNITDSLVCGTEFQYAVRPDEWDSWQTKASRAWRDEREAAGIIVVDAKIVAQAKAMAESVRSHPQVARWLSACRVNIALFGTHEPTGEPTKALLDMAPDDYAMIPDLKTTCDASIREFGKSIAEFGYDVQAAWYRRLWFENFHEWRNFALIAVESKAPYTTVVHVMPEDAIARAEAAIDRWMARYVECKKTGQWASMAEVPRWRFQEAI